MTARLLATLANTVRTASLPCARTVHMTRLPTSRSDCPRMGMDLARRRCLHMATATRSIPVTFILPDGEEVEVKANHGETILDVAIEHDIDIEGACGGTLACSTCHVIVDQENFDKLEEPSEEELDMLDLAIGLEDTSRLGCQIEMCSELAGIRLAIPDETGDIRGF